MYIFVLYFLALRDFGGKRFISNVFIIILLFIITILCNQSKPNFLKSAINYYTDTYTY